MLLKMGQTETENKQKCLTLVADSKIKVTTPASLLEKVLISKLKAGDSDAFCNIFTAYYLDFVMFALRFTNDLSCAEDIVQETFVKLWEDREIVNPTVSLKSFLLKTVQNKSIDWCRHQKILLKHSNLVKASPIQVEYDTDSYVLYTELQEKIDNALQSLPSGISEAFRMNRYQNLKYNEIAVILGVSVRTVEVRIGQALHLLRKQLKEYFVIIIGFMSIFSNNVF